MMEIIKRLVFNTFFGVLKYIVFLSFFTMLRGRVYGKENIPKSNFILVSNHASYLDWIVLYTYFLVRFKRKISFLGNVKLGRQMFWKQFMKCGNVILVDDTSLTSVANAYRLMKERLEGEAVIGIFPEGTRSPDGKLLEGKSGIITFALKSRLPILPVGLRGFYNSWPRHRSFPIPAKCSIHFGEAIDIEKLEGMFKKEKNYKAEATKYIMGEISKLI